MKSLCLLSLLSLMLVACGPSSTGDSPDAGEDVAALDPSFGGYWSGTLEADGAGGAYAANVGVRIAAHGLDVTGLCSDGSGAVTAHGNGNAVVWNAQGAGVECTDASFQCPRHEYQWTGAVATVSGDTLHIRLSGACGDHLFSADFHGARTEAAP